MGWILAVYWLLFNREMIKMTELTNTTTGPGASLNWEAIIIPPSKLAAPNKELMKV